MTARSLVIEATVLSPLIRAIHMVYRASTISPKGLTFFEQNVNIKRENAFHSGVLCTIVQKLINQGTILSL
jgi:hypothetical protein